MNRILLALSLSLACASAMAQTLDTSKLSEAQRKELAEQVTKMTSDPVNISATVRKEAEAWGDMGANMGKALVGAAREVGVASNEFAATPLGKITVAIVAYKIIGKDLLGVVVGLMLMVVAYPIALYVWFSRRWNDRVKYEYTPYFGGYIQRARVIDTGDCSEGVYAFKLITGAALIVLSSMVGLNLIF